MAGFNIFRLALLLTVIVYYVFEYFDKRQIKDEREVLIQLKTYELVHRVTTSTLIILSVLYFFYPHMPAIYPVLSVMFSFLYTEIIGKLYFRKKY